MKTVVVSSKYQVVSPKEVIGLLVGTKLDNIKYFEKSRSSVSIQLKSRGAFGAPVRSIVVWKKSVTYGEVPHDAHVLHVGSAGVSRKCWIKICNGVVDSWVCYETPCKGV